MAANLVDTMAAARVSVSVDLKGLWKAVWMAGKKEVL